jgi:hypothetical protein
VGQILHGSAKTTIAVRAARKKRGFVHDGPMGLKEVRSTVLSPEEEAIVVAFRRYPRRRITDGAESMGAGH